MCTRTYAGLASASSHACFIAFEPMILSSCFDLLDPPWPLSMRAFFATLFHTPRGSRSLFRFVNEGLPLSKPDFLKRGSLVQLPLIFCGKHLHRSHLQLLDEDIIDEFFFFLSCSFAWSIADRIVERSNARNLKNHNTMVPSAILFDSTIRMRQVYSRGYQAGAE
jgi:hypothetical protein